MAGATHTSIRITSEQKQWIDKNSVNLSKFVRKAIDKVAVGCESAVKDRLLDIAEVEYADYKKWGEHPELTEEEYLEEDEKKVYSAWCVRTGFNHD